MATRKSSRTKRPSRLAEAALGTAAEDEPVSTARIGPPRGVKRNEPLDEPVPTVRIGPPRGIKKNETTQPVDEGIPNARIGPPRGIKKTKIAESVDDHLTPTGVTRPSRGEEEASAADSGDEQSPGVQVVHRRVVKQKGTARKTKIVASGHEGHVPTGSISNDDPATPKVPALESVNVMDPVDDPRRWHSPGSDDQQARMLLQANPPAEQDTCGDEIVPGDRPQPSVEDSRLRRQPPRGHESPNDWLPPSSPPPESADESASERPRFTQAEKGKRVSPEWDLSNEELDEEEVDEGDRADEDLSSVEEDVLLDQRLKDDWQMAPGPLSAAQKLRCQELGAGVMADAQALAKELKKSTRNILQLAGLLTPSGRSPSLPNDYRSWHASEHPKQPDESMKSWRQRATDDYELWKMDLWDPADDEQREVLRASLRPEVDGDLLRQTGARRVRAASKQFSGLAQAFSNMEDIEIVGAVVYTGTDHRGRTSSSVFGGSHRVRVVLENAGVPIESFLDTLETCLKATKLSQKGLRSAVLQMFGGMDGQRRVQLNAVDPSSLSRDAARSMMSSILCVKLAPFLERVDHKINLKKDTFPWTRWPATAWEAQVCLVNWVDDHPPPGPNLQSRSLQVGTLRSLLSHYVKNSKATQIVCPEVDIVSWTDAQIALEDDDPGKAEIPLVTSVKGKVLYKLGECREWVMRNRKKRKRDRYVPKDTSRDVDQSAASDNDSYQASPDPPLPPHKTKRRLNTIIKSDDDDDPPTLPSPPPPPIPIHVAEPIPVAHAERRKASTSRVKGLARHKGPPRSGGAPGQEGNRGPFLHQAPQQAPWDMAGYYPPGAGGGYGLNYGPVAGGSGAPHHPPAAGGAGGSYHAPMYYPPPYYGGTPAGYPYPPHMGQGVNLQMVDQRGARDGVQIYHDVDDSDADNESDK